MKQGLIFDIERFSTADGPGIRTVVFFKGCNLRCYWCHNPESYSSYPILEYDSTKCIECGSCLKLCSNGVHYVYNGEHMLEMQKCRQCFDCVRVCPGGALKQVGSYMSVEECMSEILEDLLFYRNSGGGVTLSGGEVLMQPDFARNLLQKCKEQGIQTAIESNLCAPWPVLKGLLEYIDIVYCDIKHLDPVKHKEATGLSNKQIFENIDAIEKYGKPFCVRTPVIPGFNDEPELIRKIAEYLSDKTMLQYYELLSFNPLGEDKRKRLGMESKTVVRLHRQAMLSLAQSARSCSLPVWLDGKAYSNNSEDT